MRSVGCDNFIPLDVLILHNLNHRSRQKRLADICFVLHIVDQHTVNYSLKKLVNMGLAGRKKRGKEIFYFTTDQGKDVCESYRKIRETCLTSVYRNLDQKELDINHTATILRTMSGLYDQASRAASSL